MRFGRDLQLVALLAAISLTVCVLGWAEAFTAKEIREIARTADGLALLGEKLGALDAQSVKPLRELSAKNLIERQKSGISECLRILARVELMYKPDTLFVGTVSYSGLIFDLERLRALVVGKAPAR